MKNRIFYDTDYNEVLTMKDIEYNYKEFMRYSDEEMTLDEFIENYELDMGSNLVELSFQLYQEAVKYNYHIRGFVYGE